MLRAANVLSRALPGVCLLLSLALSALPARAQTPVSIELVLAVDNSVSVDDNEYRLQMAGIADALRDPEVLDLIASHRDGIAVTLTQWSTGYLNRQIIRWRVLRDRASVLAFAKIVEASPRREIGHFTAIGSAITHAVKLIESNGYTGRQRKIDISGDGRNNSGPHPSRERDRAVASGIVINGLPVLDGDPRLANYFSAFVTGGPRSFVMPAANFHDFARAMRIKLIRELSVEVSNRHPLPLPSAQVLAGNGK